MFEIIILLILWFSVGILSLENINSDNDLETNWQDLNLWWKFLGTTTAPVILIYIKMLLAFKK